MSRNRVDANIKGVFGHVTLIWSSNDNIVYTMLPIKEIESLLTTRLPWANIFCKIFVYYLYIMATFPLYVCFVYKKGILLIHYILEWPAVAQRHKVWLYNRLVVGSIPTRGSEVFIYIYIFISSLWCRGKAEFHHLTRNASRTRWKMGNGVF